MDTESKSDKFHYYGYKALPLFLGTPLYIRAWSQEQKTKFLLGSCEPRSEPTVRASPPLKYNRVQEQKAGENSTKTLQALFQNAISQSIKMLCKQKSSFPSALRLLINTARGCICACPTSLLTRHGFVRSKECYLVTYSYWNMTSNHSASKLTLWYKPSPTKFFRSSCFPNTSATLIARQTTEKRPRAKASSLKMLTDGLHKQTKPRIEFPTRTLTTTLICRLYCKNHLKLSFIRK